MALHTVARLHCDIVPFDALCRKAYCVAQLRAVQAATWGLSLLTLVLLAHQTHLVGAAEPESNYLV